MNYLCKTNPDSLDLARLRSERKEIESVIAGFRAGIVGREEFLVAVNRIDDLLFLTKKLVARKDKPKLSLVASANEDA